MSMAMSLPAGTVTFLFTDVEGSTRLWDSFPDDMRTALALHDEILAPLRRGERTAYVLNAALAWVGVVLTVVLSTLDLYDRSAPEPGQVCP